MVQYVEVGGIDQRQERNREKKEELTRVGGYKTIIGNFIDECLVRLQISNIAILFCTRIKTKKYFYTLKF